MKKIILVTLQGANYGNRLQNYAMQCLLKNKGFEVVNPYYTPVEYRTIVRKIKHALKMILGNLGIKKFKKTILKTKKEELFKLFDSEFIDNMIFVDFTRMNNFDSSEYTYGIVGSDQVWHNWTRTKGELKYFYLMFMPKEKRISYAPSFGFENFQKDIDIHKKGLSEISELSIRESNGKRIIKELTGRDAEVVPDPTLLLKKEEWESFEKKPDLNIPCKYAFLYFLGEKQNKLFQLVDELKEKNIQIIDVSDINSEYFLSNPNNFVWLIHNAEYVLTDSFHACVFSLIFSKKFVVFRREDKYVTKMFDRIETLLNKVMCEHCIEDNITSINDICDLDADKINEVLLKYREVGISYLDRVLG